MQMANRHSTQVQKKTFFRKIVNPFIKAIARHSFALPRTCPQHARKLRGERRGVWLLFPSKIASYSKAKRKQSENCSICGRLGNIE